MGPNCCIMDMVGWVGFTWRSLSVRQMLVNHRNNCTMMVFIVSTVCAVAKRVKWVKWLLYCILVIQLFSSKRD